jgi:hypothetical protein
MKWQAKQLVIAGRRNEMTPVSKKGNAILVTDREDPQGSETSRLPQEAWRWW